MDDIILASWKMRAKVCALRRKARSEEDLDQDKIQKLEAHLETPGTFKYMCRLCRQPSSATTWRCCGSSWGLLAGTGLRSLETSGPSWRKQ
eukprot:12924177-Prorocentrum_lima.AAC.1